MDKSTNKNVEFSVVRVISSNTMEYDGCNTNTTYSCKDHPWPPDNESLGHGHQRRSQRDTVTAGHL